MNANITIYHLDNKKNGLISFLYFMANLKSSKKDVRRIIKKTAQNASQKSKVRTLLRKAKEVIMNCSSYKDGYLAVVEYEKNGMIAVKKHLFSKQSVSRNVSKLVVKLKSRFKQEEQVA